MSHPKFTGANGAFAPKGCARVAHSLFCLLLVLVAWLSLNFYTYHRLYTDAGVFTAVARHAAAGESLYLDVWDHKPPVIYFINMLPVFAGDGSVAYIRFFERIYGIGALLALYFMLRSVFKNNGLAFIMALGFNLHFYDPNLFQGGDVTEEYGAQFLIAAVFSILLSTRKPNPASEQDNNGFPGTYASLYTVLAGVLLSFAVFTKEPFLLSALVWLGYLAAQSLESREQLTSRLILALLGAMVPAALFLLYFIVNGSLMAWIDVVSYNFNYAESSQSGVPFFESVRDHIQRIGGYLANQTVTFRILFAVGCISCLVPPFIKHYRFFPCACLAAFIFESYATMISRYDIGHYYLQMVPSYILLCASGGAFVLYWLDRLKIKRRWGVVVLLLSLALFDRQPLSLYWTRLSTPQGRLLSAPISNALNELKQEGDTLWVGLGTNANFYMETGMLSTTKYIYLFEHHFLDSLLSTADEKRALLTREIMTNPPTYMILSDYEMGRMRAMGLNELVDWIQQQYSNLYRAREGELELYRYSNQTSPNETQEP